MVSCIAQHQLDALHKMIAANPKTIAWARTAVDVRTNAKRGVLSALFGLEGAHGLLPGGESELTHTCARWRPGVCAT